MSVLSVLNQLWMAEGFVRAQTFTWNEKRKVTEYYEALERIAAEKGMLHSYLGQCCFTHIDGMKPSTAIVIGCVRVHASGFRSFNIPNLALYFGALLKGWDSFVRLGSHAKLSQDIAVFHSQASVPFLGCKEYHIVTQISFYNAATISSCSQKLNTHYMLYRRNVG